MTNSVEINCQIPATNGNMDAYLARPPQAASKVGILLFVEIWGMTAHMVEVAKRLAAEGHTAVVCDLFRGQTPPNPVDPPEEWAKVFANFDDVRCTNDCRLAAKWMKEGGAGAPLEHIIPWGFCMGGRFAHNLGAISDDVSGVINFYGRINFPRSNFKPFLPIEITGLINKPYLGAFAETDSLMPPHDIENLRAGLMNSPHAQINVYPGTQHAFFNDHRDVYHADAAALAWQRVLSFIKTHT